MRLCALVLLFASVAHAEDRAPALLIIDENLPARAELERAAAAHPRALAIAAPVEKEAVAAEALLAEVRPLYRDMAFARAVARLEAAEKKLIAARLPTPELVRALAEVLRWTAANQVLARRADAAAERFALAKRLAPGARPDRIFPPKVHARFAAARATGKVRVAIKLAPAGARLWLDGTLASTPLVAAPGLHYVVVERADRVPWTQLVRVPRTAAEIAVHLGERAAATDALRAAAERARLAPLSPDEGTGVAAALGRALWIVRGDGETLALDRFASDAAPIHLDSSAEEVVDKVCRAEPDCLAPSPAPFVAPALAPAPPVVAPTPSEPVRPVWKKSWFWITVGGAALLVLAGITAAAVVATEPRDYVVTVR